MKYLSNPTDLAIQGPFPDNDANLGRVRRQEDWVRRGLRGGRGRRRQPAASGAGLGIGWRGARHERATGQALELGVLGGDRVE